MVNEELFEQKFGEMQVILFGEGYGAKIRKSSLVLPTFTLESKSERPMCLMWAVQEINSYRGIRIFTNMKLKAKINLLCDLMA